MRALWSGLVSAACGIIVVCAGCSRPEVSYANAIQPILDEHCSACHQPGGEGFEKSGFATTSYDSVMKGTRFGPVVVPGSSASSTLIILVSGKADPSINMPHGKSKIPSEGIRLLTTWVDQGAKNN